MNSTFTTMLFPEFHRMAELKDHKFPQVAIPEVNTNVYAFIFMIFWIMLN